MNIQKPLFGSKKPSTVKVEDVALGPPWKILVVDDEEGIHAATRLALSRTKFRGRKLKFISAYSGAEAIQVLQEQNDIALVLLDVVMETETAGLDVAETIRQQLDNHIVRIVLRTGQPGQAPERSVIERYDINDYREKTELSTDKLFTAVIGSLRNYEDILTIERSRQIIEANRNGLLVIIDAAKTIFQRQSVEKFADGVLQQLRSLVFHQNDALFAQSDGFVALSEPAEKHEMKVVAATERFASHLGQPVYRLEDQDIKLAISDVIAHGRSSHDQKNFIGSFETEYGGKNVLAVMGNLENDLDRGLLNLYCENVGVALDNILLREEIDRTQREIIYRLGEAVETRSRETGNHIRRVAEYSQLLAKRLDIDELTTEWIGLASTLHDVGKIGVPDSVLLKPGPLTPTERADMERHSAMGYSMLADSNQPILRMAATISLQHHEKWNGTGYPNRLSGQEIDIVGRIVSVADVFDALASDRVYKKAWDLPRVWEHLANQREQHFDPTVLDAFMDARAEVEAIRDAYGM